MEWIIVAIVVVVLVSGGLGAWTSFEAPRANGDELAANNCAQCELDRIWYEGQPWWHQAAIIVWWLANRAACALKGC